MKRLLAVLGLLLFAGSLTAQTGAGVIDGSVIDDAGSPVPGASVALMTEAGRIVKSMTADDRGLFLFDALPDARYTLSASRLGYSTRAFGQTTTNAGTVVVALAGNGRYRARIRIPRLGIIAGAITDEHLQPFSVAVHAQRFVMRSGQRVLDDHLITTTADRQGRYRLVDMEAGDYLISAAGPEGALRRMSPEVIQRAQQAVEQRMAPPPDGDPSREALVSYVPVFFPGVVDRAKAQAVSLDPGDERANVDLRLQVVPVANQAPAATGVQAGSGGSVSGRVVFDGTAARPDCRKGGCAPMLRNRNQAGAAGINIDIAGVMDEAGPVMFSSVPLGSYTVGIGVPLPGWSMASAIIDGKDAMDVPIDLGPGQNLSGLVVTFTDRNTELTGNTPVGAGAPTADLVSVVVFPVDQRLWLPGARRVRVARPDTHGDYRIAGLPPGDYFVAAVTNFDPERELDAARLGALQSGASRTTVRAPEPR